jgi:hypothetical protein
MFVGVDERVSDRGEICMNEERTNVQAHTQAHTHTHPHIHTHTGSIYSFLRPMSTMACAGAGRVSVVSAVLPTTAARPPNTVFPRKDPRDCSCVCLCVCVSVSLCDGGRGGDGDDGGLCW